MVTTRKATQKAEERRISQIGDFKNRLGGIQELPSGLIVRVRNPGGLQSFVSAGTIPNSLMAIINKGIAKGKGAVAEEIVGEDGKIDPKMMNDMMALMDAVALKVIVEPKIEPRLTEADLEAYNLEHPNSPADNIEQIRNMDLLYVDELPDDDKNFLFQWISGGTRDLEIFRERLDSGVDAVATVSGSRTPPVNSDGTDNR